MALTRGCSPELVSILSGHFYPALLTYADWPDGAVRIHSGTGAMSWGGQEWLGAGIPVNGEMLGLVEFRGPAESTGLSSRGASVRVATTIETMLAEYGKVIRNREISIYFAVTTKPGGSVLAAEPVSLFTGYFDERTFSLKREDEDYSHDMELGLGVGPPPRASASITHGPEDQKRAYPGDTAGRQVINAIRKRNNPDLWPAP